MRFEIHRTNSALNTPESRAVEIAGTLHVQYCRMSPCERLLHLMEQ